MRKKSELFFSFLLLPIDFAAILSAFIAAYALRVKIDVRPVAHPLGIIFFLKIFLLIIPIWILFFALSGLYNQSSLRSRLREIGRIFVAVSAGVMFMILVDFVSQDPIFPSKSVPIYAYIFSLITVVFGREIVRAVQKGLLKKGVGVYKAVIVGSGPLAQQLLLSLKDKGSGYKIIGAVDSAQGAQQRMKGVKVNDSLSSLLDRLKKEAIDEIIQADSSLKPDEIYELVEYSANNHITYRFIPNQFGLFATHSELSTLAGMPIVAMKRTPLDGWGRIVKRTFDLAGAIFGLIILSPIFLLVAVLIKILDPGRVFYRHRRLSRIGKNFYVYKFRTMKAKYSTGKGFSGKTDAEVFNDLGKPELAAEFAREQKLKDDPRVSRLGKFLRQTSLDELPQLVNILRGDISLVGPRPIVTAELKKYGSGRSTLLSLRPGLTGLWQISGRNDISYEERVKLDIYYIENWSLLLDLKIIFRTSLMIVTGRGAY